MSMKFDPELVDTMSYADWMDAALTYTQESLECLQDIQKQLDEYEETRSKKIRLLMIEELEFLELTLSTHKETMIELMRHDSVE